ncbi:MULTISPECIES: hypothetical protein [Peptoniphilus]|uniref:hypothetical protein n=1 Tax=Peptoniphilus TaxID=162289 RepID=UPI0001DA9D5E|nr:MULTISPECIES: hypothetical protein [Peptoniphilus]EFI42502.1 hypothetical protein HMPREF0629_01156 [Peptoniphilus sp. oral taxon 386 str. F0131]
MSKKLKNVILFGIFILILFVSTITKQFSSSVLWTQPDNKGTEFSGLLFKNPTEISNLTVARNVEKTDSGDLIRYDVEFEYQGDNSSLRILGVPVRQIFFNAGVVPSHSEVVLKGDYDKINEKLFNEKLSLKDSYKKTQNYEFKPVSQIRVPLKKIEGTYSFSIFYEPKELVYKGKDVLSKTSVFITNAKVDKFTNAQKMGENENPTFSDSGYYVNAQEMKNNSVISRISLVNNLSYVIFIVSFIITLAVIWLDKKSLNNIYIITFMLILLTFYRFLGMGVTILGALVIMPILAYIGVCITKLMNKDTTKLSKKELKQSLAYTILFFIIVLLVIVIPKAM